MKREISPITMDILMAGRRALGLSDPEEFKPFMLDKASAPKLVRRRTVTTRSGLVYELHSRTDYEGKGKIAMYETDPDAKGRKRMKVAEVLVHGHDNVDETFNNIVRLIGKETTVIEGEKPPARLPSPPPVIVERKWKDTKPKPDLATEIQRRFDEEVEKADREMRERHEEWKRQRRREQ